ncbi:hypothetical protein EJV47_18055 [Hymenobacter gummosus]|uniref:Exo-alpha-sialidase n=1 Tax=Hymenobacter gummosus TaxID=1776032 RepID=A0A431U018_9BACT|nr:hypothetical protein [Hymenobacter gummosus]RTQ47822.1 hypothetical protein EJV47_18055 [Hymenobacter gummosus]
MNAYRYSLPLLLGTALLTGACTKEKIVVKEVRLRHSWTQDTLLTGYNKILLTAQRVNDSLLVVGNNSTLWYVRPYNLKPPITGAYFNLSPSYGSLVQPSLGPQVSVAVSGPNTLQVFATRAPVSNMASFTFRPTYSTSTNTNKAFPLPISGNGGYAVVDGRYVLAPTENSQSEIRCTILRVGPRYGHPPGAHTLELKATRPVTLTPAPSTIGFSNSAYFSAAYFHKFFIGISGQFYRVDTLGRVKEFGYGPVAGPSGFVAQMFVLRNRLFALSGPRLYVSLDQGETWNLYADFSGGQQALATYHAVGDALYASFQSQLWRVRVLDGRMEFIELDNDGLQTSQITSVNKCGPYAFITTLSGLYYRDTTSLNTPRKQ